MGTVRQSINIFGAVLALGVLAVVAYEYVAKGESTGLGFSLSSTKAAGGTPLEKAMLVGKSTKADLDVFKENGGLENSNEWRGFLVYKYQAVHEPSGTLGLVIFQLLKGAPKKVASMANLKEAMSGDCGTNWVANRAGNGTQATSPAGITCMILDPDTGFVEVTMGRVEASQPAIAPVPASPTSSEPSATLTDPLPGAEPVKVGKTLKYVDGQRYLLTGTIVKPGANDFPYALKLDSPVVLENKTDIGGGKLVSDFHDGLEKSEFGIDVGADLDPLPPLGEKRDYVVDLVCPRAGCWLQSVKLP